MNKIKATTLAASILFAISSASALEGYVIESGPNPVNTLNYHAGTDGSSNSYYLDSFASNPDIGLMVCPDTSGGSVSTKYLGLEYSMDGSNSRERVLVTRPGSTEISNGNGMAETTSTVQFEGKTCRKTSIGPTTVAKFSYNDATPTVKIGGMPGDMYLRVSDNQDGSSPEYLDIENEFAGGYSGSLSYTYETNRIDASLDSIRFNIHGGGISTESVQSQNYGVSSERPLILGVCQDTQGTQCPTLSERKTVSGSASGVFDVSKENVNDQNVYTRFGVANAKRFETLEIGADLEVNSLSVSKDPIFYSQTQEIEFSIENTGNVPVESDFEVEAVIQGPGGTVDTEQFQVTGGIPIGDTVSETYEWNALAESGNYDVTIQADQEDVITEIDENDNSESRSFELKPITLPEIYVNGQRVEKSETTFPDPGVPYNFSVKMENSDNLTLANSTVEIIQNDGTNSFSPTQEINEGKVTGSLSQVTYNTDPDGEADITLIPSGNVLLSDKYSNLDIQEEINYSIRLTGSQEDGTEFKFINDGKLQDFYPLNVSEPGVYDGTGTSDLPNLDEYVKLGMDGVYTIFVQFWGAVT